MLYDWGFIGSGSGVDDSKNRRDPPCSCHASAAPNIRFSMTDRYASVAILTCCPPPPPLEAVPTGCGRHLQPVVAGARETDRDYLH